MHRNFTPVPEAATKTQNSKSENLNVKVCSHNAHLADSGYRDLPRRDNVSPISGSEISRRHAKLGGGIQQSSCHCSPTRLVALDEWQYHLVALRTAEFVDKRLIYMTPSWKEAFLHAMTKGESLGFEMAVASSPGWSESGGPWVKPSQAMKKLVWSETLIEGGVPLQGELAPAPTQTLECS